MSWKRMSILIILVIVLLNILFINYFLFLLYNLDSPPEGLPLEMLPYVWYAEIARLKKHPKVSQYEEIQQKVKGEINITPAIGYNDASIYYEITVENKTAFPLSDVIIKPFLSQDLFFLDEDKKRLPVVRPYDSETTQFKLKSKKGEPGEVDVLGTVHYYNPRIDEYEEHILKPKPIKIVWPTLKQREINAKDWEEVSGSLAAAEEILSDIPLSGKKCSEFVLDSLRDIDILRVSQDVDETNTFRWNARYYAEDENNSRFAAELIVTAKEIDDTPSRLKTVVYAENKVALVGLYHLMFNKVTTGLEKMKTDAQKRIKETELPPSPQVSRGILEALESQRDVFVEFDRIRNQIETIEKDKIGVDSKFGSLYELDELYKILAEDLVKRKIVDIEAGEEIVKKRLDPKNLNELKRVPEAYSLLCEAETSDTVLNRKDFPESGKKAIMLVYFNAVEVYVREKLKGLIPKGVTILLGENHGHINTRKKDWEKSWAVLSLGSCIHIINHNKYLFLKNEELWKQKVETLMHQVRELRNIVAHPSKENPNPKLVREKVYRLLKLLPEVLKSK
jgi:hypothetical protein